MAVIYNSKREFVIVKYDYNIWHTENASSKKGIQSCMSSFRKLKKNFVFFFKHQNNQNDFIPLMDKKYFLQTPSRKKFHSDSYKKIFNRGLMYFVAYN